MQPKRIFQNFLFLAFFLCLFQGIAYWARISLTGNVLCNVGGPLGIPVPSMILSVLVVGVLLLFFLVWQKVEKEPFSLLWLLIIAAGGSNLIERLWHGCVFDYLTLPYFPLFNAADIVLSASVVFLLWRKVYRKE